MMTGHGDGMILGGVFMWFFWILIIIIIVLLVRFLISGQTTSTPSHHEKTAMEILKERYARGEINEDEFKHRKKDLEE